MRLFISFLVDQRSISFHEINVKSDRIDVIATHFCGQRPENYITRVSFEIIFFGDIKDILVLFQRI